MLEQLVVLVHIKQEQHLLDHTQFLQLLLLVEEAVLLHLDLQ